MIYLPWSKVKARRMWAGRQIGASPQPHQGLLLYCPRGGSVNAGGAGGGRGERESKMKERRWLAERDEVRSFLHSYLALSDFLHQPLPLPALVGTFQPPTSPEVLEGRRLSYPPCLSFAPVLNLHGERVLTGMNSVPLDLWGLVPPCHSQNVFCGQQPSLTD